MKIFIIYVKDNIYKRKNYLYFAILFIYLKSTGQYITHILYSIL